MAASPGFAALFLLAQRLHRSIHCGNRSWRAHSALPKGHWEAAAALGLSRRYAFRDVVIPQVFRVVLPAFGNSSFLVVSASFALSPPDELSGWVGWVTGT
ncbi:ABC transporter permease subunit [Cupriavidus basilensis]